jgi:hypothetical protein
MRFYNVLVVLGWLMIGTFLLRFSLGMEHFTRDQIPVMLVGGPVGGLAGWYVVSREAKRRAADGKR